MKILHISPHSTDAQSVASALQATGLDVVVSTATGLRDGAHWIFNNLDVAAVILEAQYGPVACAAFLKHLRLRSLAAPAIIIGTEESGGAIDRFGLGPNDCVVLNQTLLRDLGPAVQRAVARDRSERVTGDPDLVRAQADQILLLQHQLNDLRTGTDRLFEAYPLPLCRSSYDGVIIRANRAFATLFGCPSATEKRTLELASELFNASQELAWLTERSMSTGSPSSIECVRRKVDGSRLVLRLSALAIADAIHIVVEDLTSQWLVQERLTRAQRMEAVGRLAAEVALTCGDLLRQVNEDGLKWVTKLDDPALRQSGERMLGEVTRAAGFLKQLSDYGDEQASALEPTDLHQILHDLEPILQELAGDQVQVVVPERPSQDVARFNLDLKTERVERLLINVAGYSRARMPSGGKMIFDVSPTVIEKDATDTDPNARGGPHVLLTVTEGKTADRRAGLFGLLYRLTQKEDEAPTTDGPVVDFGTLQSLVHECGGYLWMEADPPGDMTIKIHLPLRAA
jgi:PAS domain-containing protein